MQDETATKISKWNISHVCKLAPINILLNFLTNPGAYLYWVHDQKDIVNTHTECARMFFFVVFNALKIKYPTALNSTTYLPIKCDAPENFNAKFSRAVTDITLAVATC